MKEIPNECFSHKPSIEELALTLNSKLKESQRMAPLPELNLPLLTKIVGARFRGPKEVALVAELDRDSALSLQREPTNKHHDNAIMVMLTQNIGMDEEDDVEIHLGYIPREVADILAPHMDAGMNTLSVQSLGIGDGSIQVDAQ